MVERALEVAKDIASKSPIAVQTTKMQLNYARDHSVDEGLDYIVSINFISLTRNRDVHFRLSTTPDPEA